MCISVRGILFKKQRDSHFSLEKFPLSGLMNTPGVKGVFTFTYLDNLFSRGETSFSGAGQTGGLVHM